MSSTRLQGRVRSSSWAAMIVSQVADYFSCLFRLFPYPLYLLTAGNLKPHTSPSTNSRTAWLNASLCCSTWLSVVAGEASSML